MKHVLHKRHKAIESLRQIAAVKRQSTCHAPAVATSLPPDNAVGMYSLLMKFVTVCLIV